MAEILIAEDDRNVREGLEDLFAGAGYRVRAVADGAAALAACRKRRPDLLLLDVMMPARDGFQVLTELRRTDQKLPVLLLTALGESVDKVRGLGLGADDYITKPFDVNELLARVARTLVRTAADARPPEPAPGIGAAPALMGQPSQDVAETFAVAGCRVDPRRMTIQCPGRVAQTLKPREVGLLRLLARHPGEVLGREYLLATLWGVAYSGVSRTLDQHVAQLRKKMGSRAAAIETISGMGYRYAVPEAKKREG